MKREFIAFLFALGLGAIGASAKSILDVASLKEKIVSVKEDIEQDVKQDIKEIKGDVRFIKQHIINRD